MIPRRLPLAVWCLVGLLFSSGLALALILTLPRSEPAGKGEEQDGNLQEDEDEPAGPPFFEDVTKASGVQWTCRNGEEFGHCAILEQLGGGVGLIDFDGDGLLDLFVTHLGNETHTLWRQGPVGQFRDRTQESRVVRTAWRGTGFGAVAADFDRDGWPDIAYVNGRVHREKVLPEAKHLPAFWQPYAERNQLLRNTGKGQFEDISAAQPVFCGQANVARGLAVGDFDNDGRPDLLVVSVGDRARLYRNVAPGGHWVGVRVTDPARGNRDLLGTVVRVTAGGRTWVQVAQSAHSYLSASDPRPLFGLGGATAYDRIEVTWPDGTRERWPGGRCDRYITVRRGGGTGQ